MPDEIGNDRIDVVNARLMIDATPQVRALATSCLQLLGRFNASHSMQAPVEVDEHGLYRYRFDHVREQDEQASQLVMRMALGDIAGAFSKAVDALAERMRVELHSSAR